MSLFLYQLTLINQTPSLHFLIPLRFWLPITTIATPIAITFLVVPMSFNSSCYIRWKIDASNQSNIIITFLFIWHRKFIGKRKQNNILWILRSEYSIHHPQYLQWLQKSYHKYFFSLSLLVISKCTLKTRNRGSHWRCT